MLPKTSKACERVLALAFIRQALSPVSKGRKYNKMCRFQNLQVVWLYWHGFLCTLMRERHVNSRVLFRADAA